MELELQNAKLKKTLKEYKEDTYSSWEIFKMNFNTEVDNLGKSISALSKK
jgi:hypothetical protein